MEEPEYIKIQRWRLVRYCEILLYIRGFLFIGLLLMPLGFGKAIQNWAYSLKYHLGRDDLSVYSCFSLWGFVLYRQDKRIPLSKITDVKLVQGPILNYMDLWNLHIQTAGTGTNIPEAILYSLEFPEQVRDDILAAIRDIGNRRTAT